MPFEYDKKKSESNLIKHGIDFNRAQLLWDDPDRLEIPVRVEDEERFVTIGKINDKIWSAISTPRNGNVRIISVRRAHVKEEKLYEVEGIR